MEKKTTKQIPLTELLDLYNSVGWYAYTTEPDTLKHAIEQSLVVHTLWDHTKLIALIRAVGDGETILYIQDLLVHPDYQHRGHGKRLLEQLVADYPHVRQKMLLTDDSTKTQRFYEATGFKEVSTQKTRAFYREY